MSQFNAPPPPPPQPKPSNGMAIASLVLGILGFISCGLLGIAGLILGIIAHGQYKPGPDGRPAEGKGLATAGIITSAISIAIIIPLMLLGILLPALGRAREIANRAVCAAQMSDIYKSMYVYATSNSDQFPPDLQLLVRDGSITPKSLHCPSSNTPPGQSSYIYVYPNRGANASPSDVILYEPLNTHSNGEGINIAFGDGTVRFFTADDARAILQRQHLKLVE